MNRPPHPVIKYCVTIPIMLETTQNTANPLGTKNVNRANIKGIIHIMVLAIDCDLGSGDETVDIFCSTHIDPPHRMAKINQESG